METVSLNCTGNHNFQRADDVIFCTNCGDIKPLTEKKYDREDIIRELFEIYEKEREKIAAANKEEMERLEKMCQQEVKRGKIVQLKSEEYPRLYKDSFLFEHFLKKRGFKLLSMTNEHAVCHLEDYTILKLYKGPLEDVFVKK